MKIQDRDVELVTTLRAEWHSTRIWAEKLLVEALGIEDPMGVLQHPHRGRHQLQGTDWWYRTHGIGVDLFQEGNKGGIDFDFDKPEVDSWRLRIFLVKQLNAGNLKKSDYRPLVQDQGRWDTAIDTLVGKKMIADLSHDHRRSAVTMRMLSRALLAVIAALVCLGGCWVIWGWMAFGS